MIDRPTLMIPGPTQLNDDVLQEMSRPVVAHYGKEWAAVVAGIVRMAQQVFQTENDVFLMPGSGTAGLDAVASAVVDDGDPVVVVNNGSFGQRLIDIVHSYRGNVRVVEGPWGEAIRPEQVDAVLREAPGCRAVFVVHSDTSTGVLNPVAEIGEAARRHGALLAVDAISSLGGMDVPVDRWGIDLCVTASQKCLEAPAGLALVSVSPAAWELIERRRDQIRGYYLNLLLWRQCRQAWMDFHPYPVTVPTSLYLALRVALGRILEEGLSARFERHARAAAQFRRGAAELGLRMWAAPEVATPTVSTLWLPRGITATSFVRQLREDAGILLSEGLGERGEEMVRAGHMGPTAQPAFVDRLLLAIAACLASFDVSSNAAVKESPPR